jgi:hypothetical protein
MMKKYGIVVILEVKDCVFVDAKNDQEAANLAEERVAVLKEQYAQKMTQVNLLQRVVVEDLKPDQNEAMRAATYTCFHCGLSSFKNEWGPGWITCPRCHKVAPSAFEQRLKEAPDCTCPARVISVSPEIPSSLAQARPHLGGCPQILYIEKGVKQSDANRNS